MKIAMAVMALSAAAAIAATAALRLHVFLAPWQVWFLLMHTRWLLGQEATRRRRRLDDDQEDDQSEDRESALPGMGL